VSAAGRSVKVGVLSFAHYHANFWSEVFAARGVLEGVWDDDEARGREAAGRFGARYEKDLDALLSRCSAVAICSETDRHADLVARVAESGLAVLCEKPLATSLRACRAIVATVERTGIVFMQSFPKRFDPVSHYLRDTVVRGELGRMTLVRIRHGHFYGLQNDFTSRWYVDPAKAGGGALLDEGVHGADWRAWTFGMPRDVTAVVSDAALGLGVEDLGVATYTWPDGMIAELTASFTFAAADTSIELYGTRGTVLVSGVDLASRDVTHDRFVRRYDTTQRERRWTSVPLTPRFKEGQFHQQNALAFVDALANGTPPPVSVYDGERAVRMIAAAYDAAREGRRRPIGT
jgi:myo-inositol 2-dehydrogenase/D-chiro-inositol 1-dehydrogenase